MKQKLFQTIIATVLFSLMVDPGLNATSIMALVEIAYAPRFK